MGSGGGIEEKRGKEEIRGEERGARETRKGEGRTGQEEEGKKRKGGAHTSYLL